MTRTQLLKASIPCALLIFMLGCNAGNNQYRTPEVSAIPSVATTPTLVLPPSFTSIPTPDKTTPTVTLTTEDIQPAIVGFPTPIPDGSVIHECASFGDQTWFETIKPDWQIVRYCSDYEGACAVAFSDKEITETRISPTWFIPGSGPIISPDGKWLAYDELSSDNLSDINLWVVSLDGTVQISIPWKDHWGWLGEWISNTRLLILGKEDVDFEYDPFTGNEVPRKRLPELPEPQDINLPGSILRPIMFVSPDNQRFVYLNREWNYSLIDAQRGTTLWKKSAGPQVIVNLISTKWSPNNNLVAITAQGERGGELYVIDKNGVEVARTDLASAYPSGYLLIGNFEWSPNGRLIAIWVNFGVDDEGGEIWNLFVLDIKTGAVKNYCIPSYGLGAHDHFPFSVWSPDSQQIVLQSYLGDEIEENIQTIIDLSQNKAFEIPHGGPLIGWMTMP
jgi:hypothetical protein